MGKHDGVVKKKVEAKTQMDEQELVRLYLLEQVPFLVM